MQRLLQASRGDRVDGVEATSVLKTNKEKEEIARFGGASFTWSVFEIN